MDAKLRTIISLVVALVLASLYLAASWFLLNKFAMANPLPETSWQRALIIFNGIASVGFTAIGVLLGTSVQQTNVASARQEAVAARADSARKTEAIKGGIEKLVSIAQSPADVGGRSPGPDSRVAEAHKRLLEGLN